jgi:hypothetical protein
MIIEWRSVRVNQKKVRSRREKEEKKKENNRRNFYVDGMSFGWGRRNKPWHHRSPRNCQGSCDDGKMSCVRRSTWPSVFSFVSACVMKRDSMNRRNINEHCSGTNQRNERLRDVNLNREYDLRTATIVASYKSM